MAITITKQQFISQIVENGFSADFRELLAFFDSEKVFESIVSYLQLNHAEELSGIGLARYRQLLTEALITLLDRGAIVPVSTLNVLAHADLLRLRKETGVGYEAPPPTTRQSTAEELLEHEVRRDYANLPGDKMREKRRSSRAYEAMFQKIADTLDSRITANVRAGA